MNSEHGNNEHSVATDCSTCFFFQRQKEDEHGVYGSCRRFPPVLSPLSDEAAKEFEFNDDGRFEGRYEHSFIHWVQPAVTDEDWCGEYRSSIT
jgi:hypothetical protein